MMTLLYIIMTLQAAALVIAGARVAMVMREIRREDSDVR